MLLRPMEQEDSTGAGEAGTNRALIVLAIASAIAAAAIFPLDHEISRVAVTYEPTQRVADQTLRALGSFGKADVLILALLLACLTRLRRPAIHGLAALLLITLPVLLLKLAVGRDRPSHSGDSFPSGDMTSAVAALVPLAMASRALLVPLGALIVLVGIYRVVASYHYPSDVFAAASLGFLGAWFSLRYTPRRFLRPRPKWILSLCVLAMVVCAVVIAISASSSPSRAFATYVLPLLLIAVLFERCRIARLNRSATRGGRPA